MTARKVAPVEGVLEQRRGHGAFMLFDTVLAFAGGRSAGAEARPMGAVEVPFAEEVMGMCVSVEEEVTG